MTNYTTSDFSEIHGPDEKPTVPGWYITDHCDVEKEFRKLHYGKLRAFIYNDFPFSKWNGERWENIYGDELYHGGLLGHWFGLREKPIKEKK